MQRKAQMKDRKKSRGAGGGRKDEIFLPLLSTVSTQISLVGFYAREKLVSGLLQDKRHSRKLHLQNARL